MLAPSFSIDSNAIEKDLLDVEFPIHRSNNKWSDVTRWTGPSSLRTAIFMQDRHFVFSPRPWPVPACPRTCRARLLPPRRGHAL
jgi:hypothetical protein